MEFPTVTSRAGRVCLIYTFGAGGVYPIHGAYLAGETTWIPVVWNKNGFCFDNEEESDLDITDAIKAFNAIKETQQV